MGIALHLLKEIIYRLWPFFFFGWWAACFLLGRYTNIFKIEATETAPADEIPWYGLPTIFTVVGFVVSLFVLFNAYNAVGGGNWADSCEPPHARCISESDEQQANAASLVSRTRTGEISLTWTWLNSYGAVVEFWQVLMIFAAVPVGCLLFMSSGDSADEKKGVPEKPVRDIIKL